MQLPWDTHFQRIVIPAWQAYLSAERRLTRSISSKEGQAAIEQAQYDALREGGAAAFYVHHYAEIVLRARPDWLPNEVDTVGKIRIWAADFCTMLRTDQASRDISLLGDVADALKHAVLTQKVASRDVQKNDAVLVIGRGFGAGLFGEGKFGGMDEVRVLAKSGERALTSVLQNAIDAWRRAASMNLPKISDP